MGQTLAHADRVDRSKRESHWASWENSLGVGRWAKGRAREGEKRGDLIGRGSIKPSYDLMEEQISETNLSAGWRSAWNRELLRPT